MENHDLKEISFNSNVNSIGEINSNELQDMKFYTKENKDKILNLISSLSLSVVEQNKRIKELSKNIENYYIRKPDKIGCCIYFLNYTIYLPVKLNWLQRFIVKYLFKAVHVINNEL